MAPTITTLQKTVKRREFALDVCDEEPIVTVTVTASPTVIRKWLKEVAASGNPRFVGVGVQWRKRLPADTLQLYAAHRCIIIQLAHCSRIPRRLTRFLSSNSITFAGIWNAKDSRKLLERNQGLMIKNLTDVRHYIPNFGNSSFPEIVQRVLAYELATSAEISKGNWGERKLHRAQIKQAAVDAFVSGEIALRLEKED